MTATQPELPIKTSAPLFEIREGHPNIEWLVRFLDGKDWTPCDDVLKAASKAVGEYGRRWVRRLAQRSKGRVIGQPGQAGYKLTIACTAQEYNHWRNAMKSQADEMTARVLQADRVFYSRQPVVSGNGILTPASIEQEWDYAI